MSQSMQLPHTPGNEAMMGTVVLSYDEESGVILAEGVCEVSPDTLLSDEECQAMFENVVASMLAGGR
jgi:hypothetical protein